MNERIYATALFYLDSENVTPSHLSFRMQTTYDQEELQLIAGQDQYTWLERVYGTQLGPSGLGSNACLQHYGSTETRQGRLLAFPNVLYVPNSFFLKPNNCGGPLLSIIELTNAVT